MRIAGQQHSFLPEMLKLAGEMRETSNEFEKAILIVSSNAHINKERSPYRFDLLDVLPLIS